jgi:glycosyltransferase involved in cell wall biosynthesis
MSKPLAVVLAPCPFDLDPRHGYWTASLRRSGYEVIELEVVDRPGNWRNTAERRWTAGRVSVYCSSASVTRRGFAEKLDDIPVESSTGQYLHGQFRRVAMAVELASEIVNAAAVLVANDLSGAIAALNSVDNSRVRILYDAQEIFTDSYDLLAGEPLTPAERRAWVEIESNVVRSVDQVVTVSPGIAALYLERHGRQPHVLPNFAPLEKFRERHNSEAQLPTRFVFLGRADPHRGLEELVEQWDFDPALATLDLFIPHSAAMKSLVRHSAHVQRQFAGPVFRNSVRPSEIVETLREYDVGVLPYAYPPPYDNASPNKFGEYVAAGLPVIANRQPFVANLIERLGIGTVFNWSNQGEFHAAVLRSLDSKTRSEWSRNVLFQREAHLTWDAHFNASVVTQMTTMTGTPLVGSIDFVEKVEIRGTLTQVGHAAFKRLILGVARRYLHRLGPVIRKAGRWKHIRRLAS